jgi:CubicO group peptidase (beta-lactamase class C family)
MTGTIRKAVAIAGALLIAWATLGPCQDRVALVERYLNECHEIGMFNGAVIVARGDSVLLRGEYGMADMENGFPISPETSFKIGSITKQFTTVMILQLIDEGLVGFDDPITAHITSYRKDTGDRVTVDHLLRHMSGLPSYTSWAFWEEHGPVENDRDDLVSRFMSGDLLFEPGSTYRYSNTNTFLLGVILENVTGESYATNLSRRVLDPLGMRHTSAGYSPPATDGLAVGYIKRVNRYQREPEIHSSNAFATGDIVSTPGDFLLWNKAFEPGVLLSAGMIEKMFTPYHRINRYYGRGYGWNIYTIRLRGTRDLVWLQDYNGELYGHYATITRVPEEDYLVALMSNAGKTNTAADEIINLLMGRPYRAPTPSLRHMLGKIIDERGVPAAIEAYHEAAAADTLFSRRSERQINALGYDLLNLGMVDEALEIFRLNTADHPRSSNVWDSYAEALAASGDTAAATENYRKSLGLNPRNDNARDMIRRLGGR